MKKIYHFNQLPKTVLKEAAYEVYKNETQSFDQDYYHEYEHTRDYIKEITKDFGLSPGEVNWNNDYSLSIDLSNINIYEEYIKKVLSKEDYRLYQILTNISSGYMTAHLFDQDYKKEGFVFDFTYPIDNQEEGMQFIMDYSGDKELKLKYTFPLLFLREDSEYELSEEEAEEFESDINSLAESLAEKLSDKITLSLQPLVKRITEIIKNHEDYIGSEQYFFDQLEADGYEAEKYRFNYQGEIVMIDEQFVDSDYEEIYHNEVQ